MIRQRQREAKEVKRIRGDHTTKTRGGRTQGGRTQGHKGMRTQGQAGELGLINRPDPGEGNNDQEVKEDERTKRANTNKSTEDTKARVQTV